ncbi:asparagine synthetase B family protein [Cognatitamlana onchidii]|uniref:asparagine synthetase B family protein n=1 Tax=Cognatitamlana onchidii TaxID=2562860 RepID=UPI0010A6A269|nr:asparagine synthetase B family protein [Algibacter onchidii]
MKTVKTDIIPIRQQFAKLKGPHELNLEAICVFAAIGFFLDQDTYWKDEVVLSPASMHTIDDDGFLIKSESWFRWHYSPSNETFEAYLNEFTSLFESIIEEKTLGKQVILPLSGGLDSRTQAVALRQLDKDVNSYSYSYKGGYPEAKLSKSIAKICNFRFEAFEIPKGYLWDTIADLAKINNCYSDFTHPRQMAIIEKFEAMGDVFSLGHWGDVLFDSMCEENLTADQELELVLKKIVKKGGLELATALWKLWKLPGDFESYLRGRLQNLLNDIDIKNSSAKIRAFKSMYWAPRWTSINLAVFEEKKPITLPYYDNAMCEFICTVPENFLADRQIQIEYIKKRNSKIAQITWQENKPFNLYNYHLNRVPFNVPYRFVNKIKREFNVVFGEKYIQRNWELQFLGKINDKNLKKFLFAEEFNQFIDKNVINAFYDLFKNKNEVYYSHSISILVTLSLFFKNNLGS